MKALSTIATGLVVFGAVGAMAQGLILPQYSNSKVLYFSGVAPTYQQANQICQSDFYKQWYAAASTCAGAGGQVLNQGMGVCNPGPGPNRNWESTGNTQIYCSVAAYGPELE